MTPLSALFELNELHCPHYLQYTWPMDTNVPISRVGKQEVTEVGLALLLGRAGSRISADFSHDLELSLDLLQ